MCLITYITLYIHHIIYLHQMPLLCSLFKHCKQIHMTVMILNSISLESNTGVEEEFASYGTNALVCPDMVVGHVIGQCLTL